MTNHPHPLPALTPEGAELFGLRANCPNDPVSPGQLEAAFVEIGALHAVLRYMIAYYNVPRPMRNSQGFCRCCAAGPMDAHLEIIRGVGCPGEIIERALAPAEMEAGAQQEAAEEAAVNAFWDLLHEEFAGPELSERDAQAIDRALGAATAAYHTRITASSPHRQRRTPRHHQRLRLSC